MKLYFLTTSFTVNFFCYYLKVAEYALTSVIKVLAHASGFEMKFIDGVLGKSAT